MITLYLVRHGQTLFNAQKKIQGFCDSPLTKLGIKQAQALSEKFASIHLDKVYTSTSERTIDTAKLILNERALPITSLKTLKEINFGELEGESEVYFETNRNAREVGFEKYGGENTKIVALRLKNAIDSIMQESDKQSVLIVSHGGAICCFLSIICPSVLEKIFANGDLPNCAVLKIEYDNEYKLISINDEII